MNRAEFKKLEAASKAIVSRSGATTRGLTLGFATLAKLPAEEKISAALHFVERDTRVRTENGSGDWLAWYFIDGAVRGAQVLPWTRKQLSTLLEAVVVESRVLPPQFVARAVGQFIAAHGPADAALKTLVRRAARSMWPPGSTEGSNFKKAAGKLKSLVA